jgi:hypothetical protein
MAYTERVLAGDNTQGPFAISFNYLSGSTIKVQLEDTLGNQVALPFTFTGIATEAQPSGTAVLLSQVAPVGYTVRIYKEVDMDTLVVDWSLGAELTQENLRSTSVNLMEQAQAAYDLAQGALTQVSDNSVNIEALQLSVDTVLINASVIATQANASADLAQYWADVASAGAAVANPSGVATDAMNAAIAARDAAIAARDLAVSAKDLAQTAATTATTKAAEALASANLAQAYATTAKGTQVQTGTYSAKHYAETAQDVVNAGALRWNGSAKFVSTAEPDPAQGINGDFWFKREV